MHGPLNVKWDFLVWLDVFIIHRIIIIIIIMLFMDYKPVRCRIQRIGVALITNWNSIIRAQNFIVLDFHMGFCI